MRQNEYELFNKTCKKYNILRVRNKISFMAFKKGVPVVELFLKTILSTLKAL
jgi:hypothetical protein